MPRYLASAALMLAGLVPLSAAALGLGGIDLRSGLNQPDLASAPVLTDDRNALDMLNAPLARELRMASRKENAR